MDMEADLPHLHLNHPVRYKKAAGLTDHSFKFSGGGEGELNSI